MYQEKWKEINVLQQEIETLQSRAERVTCVLSDMPRGGQGDGFVSAVDKIIELKEELNNKVLKAIDKQNEIAEIISLVEKGTYQRLLSLIYINGLTLSDVACKENYNYTYACEMHSKALSEVVIKDPNQSY